MAGDEIGSGDGVLINDGDGVLLTDANPMEATATEGDDGRRRTARLEIKPWQQPTGSRRRQPSGGIRPRAKVEEIGSGTDEFGEGS
uniref:DUF834 domain-containing protein n=1 Tax=Oryza sativa subsp. japonica TaxID=39947 RepID=Q69WT6_ORYSJ|nr:hypothetical protein [Oryza sativa Japonica Group]